MDEISLRESGWELTECWLMLTGLSVDVFVWYLTVALKLTHKINLQRRIAWFSLDVTAVFSCFFCDRKNIYRDILNKVDDKTIYRWFNLKGQIIDSIHASHGGGRGGGDFIFFFFC